MPIGPARMPLFDHLGELRRRVTIIVMSIIICAVVVYFATPTLIEIMMEQISEAMRGGQLTVLTALGGFTIRFKVACFFAVIICTPISPATRPISSSAAKEHRTRRRFAFFSKSH